MAWLASTFVPRLRCQRKLSCEPSTSSVATAAGQLDIATCHMLTYVPLLDCLRCRRAGTSADTTCAARIHKSHHHKSLPLLPSLHGLPPEAVASVDSCLDQHCQGAAEGDVSLQRQPNRNGARHMWQKIPKLPKHRGAVISRSLCETSSPGNLQATHNVQAWPQRAGLILIDHARLLLHE
eukprot:974987-Amphidinium_carterae.3